MLSLHRLSDLLHQLDRRAVRVDNPGNPASVPAPNRILYAVYPFCAVRAGKYLDPLLHKAADQRTDIFRFEGKMPGRLVPVVMYAALDRKSVV